MPRQIQGSQWDFSYGEVDPDLKRNDSHPARKGGLRQMENVRIHNSGSIRNRPGRRALQIATDRVDEITIAPGFIFRFNFTTIAGGTLNIYDTDGALLVTQAALGFTSQNIPLLTIAVLRNGVYIAAPGIQPLVTTWAPPNIWQLPIAFNGMTTAGGQNRRFFYRISPKGISMHPSATTGNITVQFSQNLLVAGHVNTLMRYINREFLITAINSPSNCNATVIESLPGSQTVTVTTNPTGIFNPGDVVIGSVSGAQGQVVGTTATTVGVQLLSAQVAVGSVTAPSNLRSGFQTQSQAASVLGFVATDILSGPGGSVALSAAGPVVGVPNDVTFWDEEVMNNLQGWPACVFADQNRLGFCNFPAVPSGIGWSAIGSPSDLYVGANPNDAMFELAPGKVQVFYVVPGPESSEFVFCDKKVYYIPISVTNPLKPGSVAFQALSGDGSAQVQPQISQEVILYANAGKNSMMAIVASGAYLRPFNTRNLSDFHAHLFSSIKAIAVPTADGTFNERYAYVINDDGSMVVGKYNLQDISNDTPKIGWGPWSGVGTVSWVSARNAVVTMVTSYPGVSLLEQLDDTLYLDASMFVNVAPPAALTPPALKGPLWFWAGQTVTLMDQVTRNMGTYQIDANGFIIPQFNGGENLTLASLVAGQPWTMTVEPFSPDAQSGADMGQRMKKRQYSYFAVYVINSTGFAFETLFSSQQLPTSPALGTPMNRRDVPAYNTGENATNPPTQRETVEIYAPQGSTFDPRAAIIKDTPGPLLICEIAMEVTI